MFGSSSSAVLAVANTSSSFGFMHPLPQFLGVALVIQLEQAGEDFPASMVADREADTLFRVMKAVSQLISVQP